MAKKIFGFIIGIFGGLLTLYFAMWPLTGNHGATWLEFLPPITLSGGMLALGVYLTRDKSKSKVKSD